MVPVLVIYTRSQSYIHPGWSNIHSVLVMHTSNVGHIHSYWLYINPLLVISTQCSVGHIHLVAQKRLQPHAQLRGDFLYWSPFMQALPSTQLYYISLLSGYGNLAQGGNLIQGGGRLQTVLQGPRLTKSSAVFCKSHLPLLIPGWKTKNYHPKTLFWSQKRSIFLGFHEFPKMGVTCSSNPHFRKFVILLLLLMPGLLQWF